MREWLKNEVKRVALECGRELKQMVCMVLTRHRRVCSMDRPLSCTRVGRMTIHNTGFRKRPRNSKNVEWKCKPKGHRCPFF